MYNVITVLAMIAFPLCRFIVYGTTAQVLQECNGILLGGLRYAMKLVTLHLASMSLNSSSRRIRVCLLSIIIIIITIFIIFVYFCDLPLQVSQVGVACGMLLMC